MTERRPEFEDMPVVRLTRPGDTRRVEAGTLLVALLLVILIIRPWGDSHGPATASPGVVASQPAPSHRPAETVRPDGARFYDPGLFGRYTVSPRWELWPTAYGYEFGLTGPLAIDTGGEAPEGSPPAPTASPPAGASQLVDVGAADLLVVVSVNTPAGTRVLDARLWWFPMSGPPTRMSIRELQPPWPVNTFHVYGLRVPGDDSPNLVARWAPGVYRLDVLADPGAEIRRIGILVRPAAGPTGVPTPTESATALPSTAAVALRSPVENRVAFAGPGDAVVTRDTAGQGSCGLVELWLAESDRPGGPCSPLTVTDVSVAAVDLGPGRPIVSLSIEQLDPEMAAVAVVDRTEGSSGGRVVATADGWPLAEGTYRLVATVADGEELIWYFRIPPAWGA
jgi:hypothetical protein